MIPHQQDPAQSTIKTLATDVFDLGEKQGPAHTFLHLLRSPVRRTLELTGDPAYTGHGKFFRFATYLYILVTGFAAARYYASDFFKFSLELQGHGLMRDMGEFQSAYGNVLTPLIAYLAFIAYFVIGYAVLKRLAPAPRAQRDYLKLRCLSGGFTGLIYIPLSLISLVSLTAMGDLTALSVPETAGMDEQVWSSLAIVLGSSVLIWAFILYLISYEVRIQKRFWGIGLSRSMAGLVVAMLLTWGLLFTLQYAAMLGARALQAA